MWSSAAVGEERALRAGDDERDGIHLESVIVRDVRAVNAGTWEYGMPAAETYRVPVPRTRNEPKSATVARARVPPYFRRRYGGRRVPPRRLRRGDKGVRMRR